MKGEITIKVGYGWLVVVVTVIKPLGRRGSLRLVQSTVRNQMYLDVLQCSLIKETDKRFVLC